MTRLSRLILAAAAVLLPAACGPTVVDPDAVDPALFGVGVEYEDWYRVDATGAVPGHGDSYRIIYVNDKALERGTIVGDDFENYYDRGSIIVKEVRELDGDQPGAIKYLGVMRMMAVDEAPDGVELGQPATIKASGWLFTYLADDIESDEEYRSSCWDQCHAAAPIAGTFLDYAR